MVDSTGASLGLFRTSLGSPGVWESLGHEGYIIRKVIAAGEGDSNLLIPGYDPVIEVLGSTDGGQTWLPRDTGIEDDRWILTLGGNGQSPGKVYASAVRTGQDGYGYWIYASGDFGNSWSKWTGSENGVTFGFRYFAVRQDVGAMAYSIIETGFFQSFVYKTQNGGGSWARIQTGLLSDLPSFDLDVSPRDEPRMLFAPTGFANIRVWANDTWWGALPHPFKDGGHFGNETPAWAPEHLFAAGVDTEDRLSAAMAPYPYGHWTMLSEGFPNEPGPGPGSYDDVDKFKFTAAPHAPLLFMSAWGRGLWMRDVSDVVAVDGAPTVNARLALAPPRPNPSSGAVTLRLLDDRSLTVLVEIIDVRGRVISRLGSQGSGAERTLAWDGADSGGRAVAAGTYYVRARSGGEIATRSVILIR
jgi:hypothetical protein